MKPFLLLFLFSSFTLSALDLVWHKKYSDKEIEQEIGKCEMVIGQHWLYDEKTTNLEDYIKSLRIILQTTSHTISMLQHINSSDDYTTLQPRINKLRELEKIDTHVRKELKEIQQATKGTTAPLTSCMRKMSCLFIQSTNFLWQNYGPHNKE